MTGILSILASVIASAFIIIDKQEMSLSVYGPQAELLESFPIACGKNYGNKRKSGDMKTPEGVFHISQIQDASSWSHDFKDGKGVIQGAYGPYFFRIDTPGHKGIGIHGTHDPESIGTRATEGCIRLKNEDLRKLRPHIKVGLPVIILPSDSDREADR